MAEEPGASKQVLEELLRRQADAARLVLELNDLIASAIEESQGFDGSAADSVGTPVTPAAAAAAAATFSWQLPESSCPTRKSVSWDVPDDADGDAQDEASKSADRSLTLSTPLLGSVRTDEFRSAAHTMEQRFALQQPAGMFIAKKSDDSFCEENEYKDQGACSTLAKHPKFQSLTLVMIIVNSLWIGVETDYNKAALLCDAPAIFQIVDNVFCFYFTFEMVVRICALPPWSRARALTNGPFVLDVFLVAVMVWETWVSVLLYLVFQSEAHMGGFFKGSLALRVLRVVRVMRFIRAGRSMPELLTFTEGMLRGVRAVATSLLLLAGVIYIFAILFTQLLGNEAAGAGSFDSVLVSMHFLFLSALCSIDKNFIIKMLDAGWMYWALWLFFILIANLTIMRMLTGVILNLVNDVNAKYKDHHRKASLEQKLKELCLLLDEDHNGQISRHEFKKLTNHPEIMERLVELGVDLSIFVDTMMEGWPRKQKLPIQDVVTQMFKCRGSNTVTLQDMLRERHIEEQMLARHSLMLEERLKQALVR